MSHELRVTSREEGIHIPRRRRSFAARNSRLAAGFTLIEMVVVVSMVLVLLSIALPMYNQSVLRAKEARFRRNLATINEVIQQYSLDKKKAPQALEDLVQAGYLKAVPADITGANTWQTDPEDPQNAWNPDEPGIAGVHSGSNEAGSDGKPYSEWVN